MSDLTTAFWGMTINNYDETDLALVQQGYPDHIRQIVYTLERGEEGTPHIQAFIKLNRQQRLSYVKKLFPRGSFKALTADVYKLNAQRYAQKLDKTAESPAVINNNPFPDPVVELVSVMESVIQNWMDNDDWANYKQRDVLAYCSTEECMRVARTPRLAKFYVSATYRSVKKQFWRAIAQNVIDTHKHTHAPELFSDAEDITDADGSQEQEGSIRGEEEVVQGEDDESDFDDSGAEGSTEDESDDSGCSESDAESED